MKVIDLLNKLANGEEIPKKIMFNQGIWEFDNADYDYHNGECNEYYDDKLFISGIDNTKEFLNSEVKIIKDEKIEKIKQIDFEKLYLDGQVYELKKLVDKIIDKISEMENKNDII